MNTSTVKRESKTLSICFSRTLRNFLGRNAYLHPIVFPWSAVADRAREHCTDGWNGVGGACDGVGKYERLKSSPPGIMRNAPSSLPPHWCFLLSEIAR